MSVDVLNTVATSESSPRPRRWRWRFSLRSLFVATTLVACGLHLVVTPGEIQRRAKQEIVARNGSLKYGPTFTEPCWSSRCYEMAACLLPQEYVYRIEEFRVDIRPGDELKFLVPLPWLKEGRVHVDPKTKVDLACIQPLAQLQELSISGGRVSEQTIRQLTEMPNLRKLDLTSANCGDKALASLPQLIQVTELPINKVQLLETQSMLDIMYGGSVVLNNDEPRDVKVPRFRNYLHYMPQLKKLRITIINPNGLTTELLKPPLEKLLPNCEIEMSALWICG
jgi:hypothetical protein